MIKMEPGCSYPRHKHRGSEELLILRGGYRDEAGEHRAGEYVRWRDLGCPAAGCDGLQVPRMLAARAKSATFVIRQVAESTSASGTGSPGNIIAGGLSLAERSEAQPLVARPPVAKAQTLGAAGRAAGSGDAAPVHQRHRRRRGTFIN